MNMSPADSPAKQMKVKATAQPQIDSERTSTRMHPWPYSIPENSTRRSRTHDTSQMFQIFDNSTFLINNIGRAFAGIREVQTNVVDEINQERSEQSWQKRYRIHWVWSGVAFFSWKSTSLYWFFMGKAKILISVRLWPIEKEHVTPAKLVQKIFWALKSEGMPGLVCVQGWKIEIVIRY